jgi:hypothetical protein
LGRPPWPPWCLLRRLASRASSSLNPSCAPLRFGTFPVKFGAREVVFECRRRGLRRATAVRRCLAAARASMCPRPPDLRSTAQIRSWGTPPDRSTVDRWTGSTSAVHRWRQQLRHRLRQPCVSTANHSPPRGATAAHPPAALASLQISLPSFQNSQICPSTSKDSYNLAQV